MLRHLTRFFVPSSETQHAYALYARIVQESRASQFFEAFGVPDTLDGRFEMILLHMFCYLHTMKESGSDTTAPQRLLIEAFFEDMDRSVRELGVGDTGVSRRVKAMANAFYGRIHAFEQAIADDAALAAAIRINTYGTIEDDAACDVLAMVAHVRACLLALHGQPITESRFLEM
jgi:cytochrome b pre-mRNA-processing protein 3